MTDDTGDLVERYEYDVYGAVTIFDGAGITLTASAIDNPYLFTARRYDPESGNYYYRARMYSPWLGRFLSMDPVGFDAGDYNLYRYVFNNPVNATDPTGEFAFIPWLAKASAEAAADALMQAAIAYFFDPTVTSVSEAIGSVDLLQVGGAFLVGLLPFGGLAKAVLEAAGEVVLNALEALGSECKDYTNEQALFDFALGIATDLVGDKLADLIVKYGAIAIEKGLKKLGIGDATNVVVRKLNELFCSFSEDTLVSTEDGLQPISVLEIGDYVLAYDETTSDIGYYPIIGVWVHNDLVLVHLVIDGELIETTPEHPFYTVDNEWIAAGDLQVGNQVRRADGDYGTVEAVEVVYQAQSMYNFTIATAHTYFVGDGQWLVHNQCFKIAGDLADYTDSEIDAAVYMARRGNDVTLRPPTGVGRTSDLLVNGVPYDVYTPTSANANNIFDNMIKKNNQAEGLLVDLRYTTVTPEDLGGSDVIKLLNESGASNIKYVVFYTGE